eukprot:TRINITY_DN5697_c0_g1_i3.p1 TRINITY_DN5697_c0_g1~~TRINITY_DN5697_c0_g1_i3.p1  ORF type:complete len:341 (+),score=76.05 TRINITY_DN5697_c0_g1_i3:564-1586(+)
MNFTCSPNDRYVFQAVSNGVLPLILARIHGPNQKLRNLSVSVVRNLSRAERAHAEILRLGIADKVIDLLQTDCTGCERAVSACIANLSSSATGAVLLLKHNVPTSLIRYMHDADQEVIRSAVRGIAGLAAADALAVVNLVGADGLSVIIELLDTAKEPLQETVTLALLSLSTCEEAQYVLCSIGAVEHMALLLGVPGTRLKVPLLSALANLAANDDCVNIVAQQSVQAAVRMMIVSDSAVQIAAARLLANVTRAEYCHGENASSLATPFLHALASQQEQVRAYAATCLDNLASTPIGRAAIRDSDGAAVLEHAAETGSPQSREIMRQVRARLDPYQPEVQ